MGDKNVDLRNSYSPKVSGIELTDYLSTNFYEL